MDALVRPLVAHYGLSQDLMATAVKDFINGPTRRSTIALVPRGDSDPLPSGQDLEPRRHTRLIPAIVPGLGQRLP